jgi:hypothetical protein
MGDKLVNIINHEDLRLFEIEGNGSLTVSKLDGLVTWGKFAFPPEGIVGFHIDENMHLQFRSKGPQGQERSLDVGLVQNRQQIKPYIDEINSKYKQ